DYDLEHVLSSLGPLEHIRAIEEYFTNHWRGDQWLKANGLSLDGYVPDIAVVSDGRILKAIESAGKYDVSRLEEIYDHCVTTGTDLFIW
ncbi:MAG: hypothetical protein KGM43_01170, partial [Planctomycetota bacterium]|nr:hypothetical protein [Planctomycetota bacterium]